MEANDAQDIEHTESERHLANLRIEFQQSGEDARMIVHEIWQVVYIFLSATVLALALITTELLQLNDHNSSTFGVILPVSIVGAALSLALIFINRRQGWLAKVTYHRMHEIERSLAIWKHQYIHILDRWADRCDLEYWTLLSDQQKESLSRLHAARPRFLGQDVIIATTVFAALGWIGLAVVELILWVE